MELILLRHGAIPETYQKRYLGHTDIGIDPELFETEKIAPLAGQTYERVYSSDLSRCTQTLERMGIRSYIPDPRLREVRFKSHIEGKSFEEIESMQEFAPCLLESMENWHRFVCEESPEALRMRLRNFLDELPSNGKILLCSHAGTIRSLLSLLRPDVEPVTPGYLEYTIVRVK